MLFNYAKYKLGRASLMAMSTKAFFGIFAINGVATKPDQFAPPTYFAYGNDGKNYPLNLSKNCYWLYIWTQYNGCTNT